MATLLGRAEIIISFPLSHCLVLNQIFVSLKIFSKGFKSLGERENVQTM